jgi:hypothetical protein
MTFWINNPTILFDISYVREIWPYSYMTRDEKLNAMTRFIILLSIIGYICINRFIIVVFGLIVIGIIVLMYTNKKEGMMSYFNISEHSDIQKNNPFSNVLVTDYKFNPNKPEFKEEYSPDLENRLNNSIKASILEQNKDNKEIGVIFNNASDNFEFEQNARQFYTNPSTTIPNTQDKFLEFCYGNLPSEKPLTIY